MMIGKKILRPICGALLALLCALPFARDAAAQAWPAKAVRLLVPFPPGGPADITARAYTDKLGAALGQPFLLENRPGPNGIIVSNAIIASPADGYAFAFSSVGGQVLAPAINAYLKRPQEPDVLKLLVPVGLLAETPLMVVVNPALNINTLGELIAYAKANPGKLNFGSDGIGSSTHLAEELFNKALGISAVHIPFKGTVDVMNAMMGGEIQYSFSGIATPLPLHRQGRVKILATGGASATAALPSAPTVAAAAKLPGFDVASWFAVFARAGTDAGVIATLSREIQKISKLPDVIERLRNVGIDALSSTPEQLAAKVDADYRKWSDLLKTGVKLD